MLAESVVNAIGRATSAANIRVINLSNFNLESPCALLWLTPTHAKYAPRLIRRGLGQLMVL